MKIVHINTDDITGGAARLGYQLHQSLRAMGYVSKMLVANKESNDPDVYPISKSRGTRRYIQRRLHSKLENSLSLQYWLRRFPFGWLGREPICSSDIINLHNIHGGYFNYLALPWLTAAKPLCWALHDMWAFTGHCGYSYECERWKTGCYSCPLLHAQGELEGLLGTEATLFDLTRFIWKVKRRLYSRSRLTIIVAATWMKEQVEQSILAEYARVAYIPDGVDIDRIRPIDRAAARQSLQIPLDVSVVLVYVASSNPRKGLKYAVDALNKLQIEPLPWIVSFGNLDALDKLKGRFQIRDLGFLHSDILQTLCYSAADVFLLPTLADNLPLTALDSLASGTPTVSFSVGGVPDIVRHMETGYLAAYKDTDDLAHGMQVILADPELRAKISRRCREVAEQEYSLQLQAQRYADLYQTLLEEAGSRG